MFLPDYYYESVYEIPYNELWARNIRGLIFDLDNTLAPSDTPRPPAKASALIKRLRRMGFQVCLLTNNTKKRMSVFNESLGLIHEANAMKPLTSGINRAMKAMGTDKNSTAIIGDQIFTDVWGGNNAKITTVLVKPISNRDFLTVKFKRLLEKPILKSYFKKKQAEKP